ncbi:stalk domain-containing protein [Paenibacillus qinlingensis]|uniref:stalk domain-containing protein n=1 Tax=Paenibacillus qinlingensis TaxID=1837343 RepID=UPI0015655B1E|nr:stalk domain-containing protein [Paenibacillus qinlingensis]NQX63736.1 S-layer homology domain-containing protein [Paenibacillus qinlingensis]
MKKILPAIITSAMLISLAVPALADTTSNPFADISGSFAKEAIIQLQKEGILTGIDAEHFDPKGTLTRAQFVTIMVKALNLPIDESVISSFTDVEGWAVPFIESAKKFGIIDGVSETEFAPEATVTREQTVVVMVKALEKQGKLDETDAKLDFTDADSISDWAKKYVAIAVKYGLVSGNPDGTFNPQGNATREQSAVMGVNFIKGLEEVVKENKSTTPTTTPAPTPTTPPPVFGGGGGGFVPTSDTQAPTAPTNVTSSDITQTTVTLIWTKSTDNVGATGYFVYQDGVKVGTVTGTTISYTVTGLTANTSYEFTVKANDAVGNVSSASVAVTVTTLPTLVIEVSNVHIQSNNVDPTKATVGDIVTLTFKTNIQVEPNSHFVFNVNAPTNFVSSGSGSSWTNTATYVITEADILGLLDFSINLINMHATINATSDSSSITIIAPAVSTPSFEITTDAVTATEMSEEDVNFVKGIIGEFISGGININVDNSKLPDSVKDYAYFNLYGAGSKRNNLSASDFAVDENAFLHQRSETPVQNLNRDLTIDQANMLWTTIVFYDANRNPIGAFQVNATTSFYPALLNEISVLHRAVDSTFAGDTQKARVAYDLLSVEQKALVTNYQTLLEAEAKLAGGTESASYKVIINGNEAMFSEGLYEKNGVVLGSIRTVAEAIGTQVTWNEATRQITFTSEDNTLVLTLDSSIAVINGHNLEMGESATIVNGSTVVPLRFVVESFGGRIEINPLTPSPIINKILVTDTILTGKGKVGTTIILQVSGGVIGTGVVGLDGNFSVPIVAQQVGTLINVIARDIEGNESRIVTVRVESSTPPVSAAYKVIINGNEAMFSEGLYEKNGVVLGSIRTVAEAIGTQVTWNEATRQITFTSEDNTLVLTLDSSIAVINGHNLEMGESTTIVNGSTVVPLRFVVESFGGSISIIEN